MLLSNKAYGFCSVDVSRYKNSPSSNHSSSFYMKWKVDNTLEPYGTPLVDHTTERCAHSLTSKGTAELAQAMRIKIVPEVVKYSLKTKKAPIRCRA